MNTQKFKIILDEARGNEIFSFIKNNELVSELEVSIAYVYYIAESIEYGDVKQEPLSELHSQTAIIYIGSITEALLYEYVFEYLKKKDPSKIKKYCKNIQYLERHITDGILKDSLVICEKKEKTLEFKGDISFQALINGVKDYKLLSDYIIDCLDEIRQKRNIVHIKVLMNFKKWWNAFNDLMGMLEKSLNIISEIKNRFIELNKS